MSFCLSKRGTTGPHFDRTRRLYDPEKEVKNFLNLAKTRFLSRYIYPESFRSIDPAVQKVVGKGGGCP